MGIQTPTLTRPGAASRNLHPGVEAHTYSQASVSEFLEVPRGLESSQAGGRQGRTASNALLHTAVVSSVAS